VVAIQSGLLYNSRGSKTAVAIVFHEQMITYHQQITLIWFHCRSPKYLLPDYLRASRMRDLPSLSDWIDFILNQRICLYIRMARPGTAKSKINVSRSRCTCFFELICNFFGRQMSEFCLISQLKVQRRFIVICKIQWFVVKYSDNHDRICYSSNVSNT